MVLLRASFRPAGDIGRGVWKVIEKETELQLVVQLAQAAEANAKRGLLRLCGIDWLSRFLHGLQPNRERLPWRLPGTDALKVEYR